MFLPHYVLIIFTNKNHLVPEFLYGTGPALLERFFQQKMEKSSWILSTNQLWYEILQCSHKLSCAHVYARLKRLHLFPPSFLFFYSLYVYEHLPPCSSQ